MHLGKNLDKKGYGFYLLERIFQKIFSDSFTVKTVCILIRICRNWFLIFQPVKLTVRFVTFDNNISSFFPSQEIPPVNVVNIAITVIIYTVTGNFPGISP